jgi:hypothetical protein
VEADAAHRLRLAPLALLLVRCGQRTVMLHWNVLLLQSDRRRRLCRQGCCNQVSCQRLLLATVVFSTWAFYDELFTVSLVWLYLCRPLLAAALRHPLLGGITSWFLQFYNRATSEHSKRLLSTHQFNAKFR